jgi:methylmalonyl-CoA mutase
MLDFAEFVAINKFDRKGAADALRDVAKQVQRNRQSFGQRPDEMPVFGTMASRFNDDGVTALYQALLPRLAELGLPSRRASCPPRRPATARTRCRSCRPRRARYLADIADTVRAYKARAREQARLAREIQQLQEAARMLKVDKPERAPAAEAALDLAGQRKARMGKDARHLLQQWPDMVRAYAGDEYVVKIRDKEIRTTLTHTTLSGSKIRKVALAAVRGPRRDPEVADARQRARARSRTPPARSRSSARARTRPACSPAKATRSDQRALQAAVGRDAGQAPVDRVRLGHAVRQRPGDPARHLRQGRQLGRLDRDARRHEGAVLGLRPVQPGDLGLDDDQRPGADDPRDVHEHRDRPAARQVRRRQRPRARPTTKAQKIRAWVMENVRGTVQADILKEDQGQNTCIFSTEFSLKVMGDIAEYFVHHKVRNFYSVSISAITSPRPARTRSRSSRSRCRTASRSSRRISRAACTSTTSRRT